MLDTFLNCFRAVSGIGAFYFNHEHVGSFVNRSYLDSQLIDHFQDQASIGDSKFQVTT